MSPEEMSPVALEMLLPLLRPASATANKRQHACDSYTLDKKYTLVMQPGALDALTPVQEQQDLNTNSQNSFNV